MELQWPLMIFTLFICLGAGVFAFQGLLVLLGKGAKVQLPALIVSAVSIVIGGMGSFLHLQHWERIFNGFGHLTSGITQELIGIVVFAAALVVYFVMMRRSDAGTPPKWCAIVAIVVSAALVVVMAHSYNMASKLVWDTPLLWVYYLTDAAFLGALAVAAIAGWKEGAVSSAAAAESDAAATTDVPAAAFSAKLSWILGVVNAVAVAAYAAFFGLAGSAFTDVGYYFDPTHPTKAMADPSAAFGAILADPVFWLGTVLVGLVAPIVLAILAGKKQPKQIALFCGIGLVCALIGGLCFRAVLYMLGFSVFVFY